MKKFILLLIWTILISSCNRNPQNITVVYDTIPVNDTISFEIIKSVQEVYEGVLPCANCKGILTEVTLNTDSSTYRIKETYQAKLEGDSVLTASGSYIRNLSQDDAAIIYKLNSARPEDDRYFKAKGDSAIVMLDKQQKEISGNGNYLLEKK